MVVAIIGSGIAGLTAANRLASAGHEVTVFEKSKGFGGRLSTRYAQGDRAITLDHGAPYLSAKGPEFKSFIDKFVKLGMLKVWTNKFMYEDADMLTEVSANPGGEDLYVATKGMNTIGKYLSRTVDVRLNTRVGGITHIGTKSGKKRAWMVNTDSQEVFEADAVVIALPATQAFGIIQTAQDETSVRRIIRELDEINYDPCLSFMFNFGKQDLPDWKALKMVDPVVSLIVNESSKRDLGGDFYAVVQSTQAFATANHEGDRESALHDILKVLVNVLGDYAGNPIWHQSHFWRYARARKTIPRPYFECDNPALPLALIGDYFNGNDAEAAYNSAIALSDHWIAKYHD